MLLGASLRSTVQLKERGITSLHCLLARDGGSWNLHDLASQRGIVVDGKRVGHLSLADGDVFWLAGMRVVFRLDPSANDLPDLQPGKPFEGSLSTDESIDQMGSTDESIDTGRLSGRDRGTAPLESKPGHRPDPHLDAKIVQAERMAKSGAFGNAIRLAQNVCADAPFVLRYRRALRRFQKENAGSKPRSVGPGGRLNLFRLRVKARRALGRGDGTEALEIAELGLSIDPWNKWLLVIESIVFERERLFEHCAWTLATALQGRPQDPTLNRPLAKIMQHVGSYNRAEHFWKQVANVLPDDREAERQIREILVQKTLRKHRRVNEDSWEGAFDVDA